MSRFPCVTSWNSDPRFGFPHSSKAVTSRYPQMRELRTQRNGRPLRTLYAFNPLRTAILLMAGDKPGDEPMVRNARTNCR